MLYHLLLPLGLLKLLLRQVKSLCTIGGGCCSRIGRWKSPPVGISFSSLHVTICKGSSHRFSTVLYWRWERGKYSSKKERQYLLRYEGKLTVEVRRKCLNSSSISTSWLLLYIFGEVGEAWVVLLKLLIHNSFLTDLLINKKIACGGRNRSTVLCICVSITSNYYVSI